MTFNLPSSQRFSPTRVFVLYDIYCTYVYICYIMYIWILIIHSYTGTHTSGNHYLANVADKTSPPMVSDDDDNTNPAVPSKW